ncbi:hypothetical protein BJ684DRAFT_11166 [Piptocephalis cylindrospora]|uniref:NAD(P)-binding protein n=1 Tax=Piptocephalis cylindrospora TaxID=1907219 RepID=A0A4P9Y1M4_9FUNG|nr:hypothetical protein BJ684DRAFT_11166 [Piptocephalis cylindrospora]|eukprot:RKP12665.1 hypothetical protein BJ684DRAFT_11166 [Piptocephalis cylindrospora]
MPSLSTTYLITGTLRGTGLEMMHRLLDGGAMVIAACRNLVKATNLCRLQESGLAQGRLRIVQLDVTDDVSITDTIKVVAEPHPRGIDVLIHNTGIADVKGYSKLLDHGRQTILHNINTNVVSPVIITQYFLPLLKTPSADKQLILMVASSSGVAEVYGISKVAVNKMFAELAIDLKDRDITVAGIHPG